MSVSSATWPAPPSPRLRRTEPAIASERLELADDGSVIYYLRRPFGDGTRAIRFDPLTFLEKLAALVPPPRAHLATYHGILAPNAAYRDDVISCP